VALNAPVHERRNRPDLAHDIHQVNGADTAALRVRDRRQIHSPNWPTRDGRRARGVRGVQSGKSWPPPAAPEAPEAPGGTRAGKREPSGPAARLAQWLQVLCSWFPSHARRAELGGRCASSWRHGGPLQRPRPDRVREAGSDHRLEGGNRLDEHTGGHLIGGVVWEEHDIGRCRSTRPAPPPAGCDCRS